MGYLLESLATLAGVCALAVAVLWGARRAGLGAPSGPIKLRGHLPLDARRSVYIVQVGEHVFVLGVGEAGFTKLGEIAATELPPSVDSPRASAFSDVLARALGRGTSP
jgi:flagellar biogenesis protein FliO